MMASYPDACFFDLIRTAKESRQGYGPWSANLLGYLINALSDHVVDFAKRQQTTHSVDCFF